MPKHSLSIHPFRHCPRVYVCTTRSSIPIRRIPGREWVQRGHGRNSVAAHFRTSTALRSCLNKERLPFHLHTRFTQGLKVQVIGFATPPKQVTTTLLPQFRPTQGLRSRWPVLRPRRNGRRLRFTLFTLQRPSVRRSSRVVRFRLLTFWDTLV